MAEIKSTMDLVMERAARIGRASSEELRLEEARKKGIQLAVEYLDGNLENPLTAIKNQENILQGGVLRGLIETLLRNIFLPRDDIQQERTRKAVKGITMLEGGSAEIASICRELTNVLGGYMQHREQLRGQLEEQIMLQYESLMAQQPGMQREGIRIDPTQQPRFKEEWNRLEAELNSQYNKALDQFKQQIGQRLGLG
ncbi:MAG TPA: hypothetical protein ENO11_06075 [Desulfobacteraceae bacterium]|nr:hypothetical protein [Desulfobacteraceae bacterium]